MTSSSGISARVLSRHRHAAVVVRDVPATSIEVVYSDGGVVSAQDVARLLADRIALLGVKFLKGGSHANVVRWVGATIDGTTVMGSLVLHAGVRGDQVVCWAEIVLDDDLGLRTAGGTPEEQILRKRLDRIGDLARRMVERARVNPQAPVSGIVEHLQRMLAQTEG